MTSAPSGAARGRRTRPFRTPALRAFLLIWIGLAALSIAWQEGSQPFLAGPLGLRYLLFVGALAAVGGVAAFRAGAPASVLTATTSALALTAISLMIASQAAPAAG